MKLSQKQQEALDALRKRYPHYGKAWCVNEVRQMTDDQLAELVGKPKSPKKETTTEE